MDISPFLQRKLVRRFATFDTNGDGYIDRADFESACSEAGLSVNQYGVRAARRAATLDAAHQLAALGLGDDLAGEGDALCDEGRSGLWATGATS
ncbi:EF-hand domain-containing protein [Streptomyces canus]|uniref:EF-hand domain-containing protein n=1 Tax=Streptomyces canus TaxID=58343 RepID=UPI003720DBCF